MSRYFILVYILVLLHNIEGKPREIECPEFCVCDVHFAFKRATCQHKNLVSIELDMPRQVEILDVSNNEIKEFRNKIFIELGLTNMKLLNVSHNKLSQIQFDSFEGLSKLKTLDLSHNRLRYLLENWWMSLENLEELYLAGNLMRSLNSEPIKLKNLKVLDLSHCSIVNLNNHVFEHIPNLQVLNLAENLLIHLQVDILKPIPLLKNLNINNNSFDCSLPLGNDIKDLKHYILNKSIKSDEICGMKKRRQKFERLQMTVEDPVQQNGWLYDEDIETDQNDTVVDCKTETPINGTEHVFVRHLVRIIELSPTLFTLFLLVFGFTLGVFFGCTCQIQSKYPDTLKFDDVFTEDIKKGHCKNKSPRKRSKSAGSKFLVREDRNLLLINESKLSDSTPMLPRKWATNDNNERFL